MPNRFQAPNKKLNFFQNYKAHIESVVENNKKNFTPDDLLARIVGYQNYTDMLDIILGIINQPLASKLNFTTPLYDKYDYTDELVGATILPLAAVFISVACIAKTLIESFHLIATPIANLFNSGTEKSPDINQKKQDNHCALALLCTLGAIIAALTALLSLIKCTISMVTRPIATLIKGSNTTHENRFGVRPEDYNSSADNSDNDEPAKDSNSTP